MKALKPIVVKSPGDFLRAAVQVQEALRALGFHATAEAVGKTADWIREGR